MKYITFLSNGRFGNNVFQYIATKIIQSYLPDRIYAYQYTLPSASLFYIREENFNSVLAQLKQNNIHLFQEYRVIVLDGYFQFNEYLEEHDELVRSLFTPRNHDQICPWLTMSMIASYVSEYSSSFTEQDLVLHFRLDDFIMDGKNSAIIHFNSYLKLLEEIRGSFTGKLYIIVDRLKYPFEIAYLHQFERYSPIILHGSMLEDFARCYYAPNFILSNSTFCWIPLLFGPKRRHWFPKNVGVFTNQKFDRLNDQSIIYDTERLLF